MYGALTSPFTLFCIYPLAPLMLSNTHKTLGELNEAENSLRNFSKQTFDCYSGATNTTLQRFGLSGGYFLDIYKQWQKLKAAGKSFGTL